MHLLRLRLFGYWVHELVGLPEVLAAASQARPASRRAPVFHPAVDYDVKLALDELAEWIIDLGIGFVRPFRLDVSHRLFSPCHRLVLGDWIGGVSAAAHHGDGGNRRAADPILNMRLSVYMSLTSRANFGDQ
jgi:hypothetical protein